MIRYVLFYAAAFREKYCKHKMEPESFRINTDIDVLILRRFIYDWNQVRRPATLLSLLPVSRVLQVLTRRTVGLVGCLQSYVFMRANISLRPFGFISGAFPDNFLIAIIVSDEYNSTSSKYFATTITAMLSPQLNFKASSTTETVRALLYTIGPCATPAETLNSLGPQSVFISQIAVKTR